MITLLVIIIIVVIIKHLMPQLLLVPSGSGPETPFPVPCLPREPSSHRVSSLLQTLMASFGIGSELDWTVLLCLAQ